MRRETDTIVLYDRHDRVAEARVATEEYEGRVQVLHVETRLPGQRSWTQLLSLTSVNGQLAFALNAREGPKGGVLQINAAEAPKHVKP